MRHWEKDTWWTITFVTFFVGCIILKCYQEVSAREKYRYTIEYCPGKYDYEHTVFCNYYNISGDCVEVGSTRICGDYRIIEN